MSAGHLAKIPHNGDLEPVLSAARSALEFESQRADRLDSKARNQMTLAGSWFAVVQAVAAVVLSHRTPLGWVIAIAATAALAGLALIVAMRESTNVWKLRPQPAVTQETLEDMTAAAQTNPETFSEQLILQYRHILGHLQEQNNARANALDAATAWWWVTLGLSFTELAVALLTRIFNA
jgi:hypothetical protein